MNKNNKNVVALALSLIAGYVLGSINNEVACVEASGAGKTQANAMVVDSGIEYAVYTVIDAPVTITTIKASPNEGTTGQKTMLIVTPHSTPNTPEHEVESAPVCVTTSEYHPCEDSHNN